MVEPIRLDEIWDQRDVTLVGRDSARVFEPFARHTEVAEIVIVHRDGADRVVMLPWRFWQRIALTITLANGDPPDSAGHHAGCEIAEKLSENCACGARGRH